MRQSAPSLASLSPSHRTREVSNSNILLKRRYNYINTVYNLLSSKHHYIVL